MEVISCFSGVSLGMECYGLEFVEVRRTERGMARKFSCGARSPCTLQRSMWTSMAWFGSGNRHERLKTAYAAPIRGVLVALLDCLGCLRSIASHHCWLPLSKVNSCMKLFPVGDMVWERASLVTSSALVAKGDRTGLAPFFWLFGLALRFPPLPAPSASLLRFGIR